MASVGALRPLAGILLAVALAALVVAVRLGSGLRPLGLGPREWASLTFSAQVFSFTLSRAIRRHRKPRVASASTGAAAASSRFTNLEFAELCALMLTVGYWFLTDPVLDAILLPGWRWLVMGILLLVPLLGKLVTERTES